MSLSTRAAAEATPAAGHPSAADSSLRTELEVAKAEDEVRVVHEGRHIRTVRGKLGGPHREGIGSLLHYQLLHLVIDRRRLRGVEHASRLVQQLVHLRLVEVGGVLEAGGVPQDAQQAIWIGAWRPV